MRRTLLIIVLLGAIVYDLAHRGYSQKSYDAPVVYITDGDTLRVAHDDREVRIRLAEIDAPEKRQPFGMQSKQSLADLCSGLTATIEPVDIDQYGRTVAHVICDGQDAGTEQVSSGMAWVYDRYVTHYSLYLRQLLARMRGVGLWAGAHPEPPWEWRHSR